MTVTAPANANLAPPGDYPPTSSTRAASRPRRRSSASPPPATRSRRRPRLGLSVVGTSGQVALSWGASSDPSGIARYSVHRSTTAGFTPSTANRVAQPPPRATRMSASSPGRATTRSRPRTTRTTRAPCPTKRPGGGPERASARARRSMGIRRGKRDDDRGQVGQQQQRDAVERDLVDASQVRGQRGLVQRYELFRLGGRLQLARPRTGDDDRGLGPPSGRPGLADPAREGAAGEHRLRLLHRTRTRTRRSLRSPRPPPSRSTEPHRSPLGCGRTSPVRTTMYHSSPLRERNPGRASRADRRDPRFRRLRSRSEATRSGRNGSTA